MSKKRLVLHASVGFELRLCTFGDAIVASRKPLPTLLHVCARARAHPCTHRRMGSSEKVISPTTLDMLTSAAVLRSTRGDSGTRRPLGK